MSYVSLLLWRGDPTTCQCLHWLSLPMQCPSFFYLNGLLGTQKTGLKNTSPIFFAPQTVADPCCIWMNEKMFCRLCVPGGKCLLQKQLQSKVVWQIATKIKPCGMVQILCRVSAPSLFLVSLNALTFMLKPELYERLHCKSIQANGRTCMKGEIQILGASCCYCLKCLHSPYPIDDVSYPEWMKQTGKMAQAHD